MAADERSWIAHAWWLERNLPHLCTLRSVKRDPHYCANGFNKIRFDMWRQTYEESTTKQLWFEFCNQPEEQWRLVPRAKAKR
jgi:hypothetical protein